MKILKPKSYFLICLALLLLTVGCSGDSAVSVYRTDKAPVPSADSLPSADAPVNASISPSAIPQGWLWRKPDSWRVVEGSSMQLAKFKLTLASGEGNCSLMVLNGSGGGLVANVNRWRQQLGLETMSEPQIAASSQTLKGALGSFTFLRIEAPGPSGGAFLTAIQPLKGQTLFVKLIAPAGEVEQLQEPFLSFCKSIRRGPVSTPGH